MRGWSMRWACALVLAASVAMAVPASGQTPADADKLNAEVVRLYNAGRYAEAIPLAERALALRETALGPEHPSVATALNNLAALYEHQGRHAEAEPLYKRTLWIDEKALGPEHPSVATSLNNLAALYGAQGRYAEAEPLHKRALSILEKALRPEHSSVATSLNNLAALYQSQGRTAEAERLYKRTLSILEKALGPEHHAVASSLNNLALLYRAQGRIADAEPLLKRSLALREKALGSEHHAVASSLNNLALLYRAQGQYAEVEPLYRRMLLIMEKALEPEHPLVATALNNLAWLALEQNNLAAAADYWRRATALLQRRAERGLGGVSEGSSKGEAQRSSWYFEGLIKTTHRVAAEGSGNPQTLLAEMFEAAQWGTGSEAAASLAQMAARSAGGSPELAALVRERQDLIAEWQARDKLLIAARSEPPARRNPEAEKSLAARLAAIDERRAAIDARLAKDFPDYAALASPKPSTVADVQATLRDDEALVLFLDTDARFNPLPEETFVWVVTRSEVRWLRSDLGTAALQREVAALRCGLDATSWADATNWPEGNESETRRKTEQLARRNRCRELTGTEVSDQDVPPFDAKRAHGLYKGLLGEAADLLKTKHLLVVPSGALTTLPFQVLVTEAPTSIDLASARWLIRDHAITVLPSVASLAALRRTGKPSAAPKPMIGFANPLLDGNQTHPEDKQLAELARAQTGCAATPKQRTAALRAISRSASLVPRTAGLADLAHLRVQTPLPESADEICEVARSIGASIADMRIGARATETEVKRLSETGELAQYRILHFATHGLLAGQLSGTREPGLILTPPPSATPRDDGYLSGSEIAGLKLDADWVILSACNTAGGAAQGEAAEALSGLARVFFYAGARALLVSHWEVDSEAAVKLVTGAVGTLARDKSLGRAEALRRAMLAAMVDTTRPQNWVPASHPAVWAPFVVVGEGGAGR